MPKSALFFGLLIVAIAAPVAFQSADSDIDTAFVLLFLLGPVIAIVGLFAASRTIRALRSQAISFRTLGIYLASVILASLGIYGGVWRWLHPSNIHYTFDYGESSTWHEVQFTHTEHGREVMGPWVGGQPLHVRFPDLNHDGYPDIRVIGNRHEIAEYTYLPHNDGKRFWHLVRAKHIAVSYPPDGQSYP